MIKTGTGIMTRTGTGIMIKTGTGIMTRTRTLRFTWTGKISMLKTMTRAGLDLGQRLILGL